MEQIKKTAQYTIFKKNSGRYAVKGRKGAKWVSGEDKVKILVAEQLVTLPEPKAAPADAEPAGEE